MFLRSTKRRKNGKEHTYWSVVESRRVGGSRVVQKHLLYLGEINDSQKAAWSEAVEVFDEKEGASKQVALFPANRPVPDLDCEMIRIRMSEMKLCRPRQWGACWLACYLWDQLRLDEFWCPRLPASREGTNWLNVLKTLVSYQLIDPGSEWRLHRQWFERSAMGDLLGEDARLAQDDTLYRCLDKLLPHKEAMFGYLQQRWKDLFCAEFEVLLYDLTSTYFEIDPPEEGQRKFGYSRDKRPDCVQVVIALVVTPDGLPLAYEVMDGNTSDKTTLHDFLAKIEKHYGKARRVWVMDRGIPTEETLAEMRAAETPTHYLCGTPRGRLSKLEESFLSKPWQEVRQSVQVKMTKDKEDLYILARSEGRMDKERSMRRRKLKKYIKRLKELQKQDLTRDQLLKKLGAAQHDAGRCHTVVDVSLPDEIIKRGRKKKKDATNKEGEKDQTDKIATSEQATLPAMAEARATPTLIQNLVFRINRPKLRALRRGEGTYLLRSNMTEDDPGKLWQFYLQLVEIEQAFKELKNDLSVRPIYHQLEHRIEAHIFIAFMAYCLHVTLKQYTKALAPGLTPRAVIEKLAAIQMIDVHLNTTDGRTVIMSRYTEPEKDLQLLLQRLKLALPAQSKPRITAEEVKRVA
jgi:transposase